MSPPASSAGLVFFPGGPDPAKPRLQVAAQVFTVPTRDLVQELVPAFSENFLGVVLPPSVLRASKQKTCGFDHARLDAEGEVGEVSELGIEGVMMLKLLADK